MKKFVAAGLVLAAFLAVAAGCGSSSSASQNTTTGPARRGARFAALASCMKSKGYTLPNRSARRPGSGPPPGLNFGDPAFRSALRACRQKVFGNAGPGGAGRFGPGGGNGPGPPGTSGQGGGTFQ